MGLVQRNRDGGQRKVRFECQEYASAPPSPDNTISALLCIRFYKCDIQQGLRKLPFIIRWLGLIRSWLIIATIFGCGRI